MFDPKLTRCSLGEYVALKIAMASDTTVPQELDALRKLSNPLATAQLPVPRLLDSFDLKGPNGVHTVLALELFGSNLSQFIIEMKLRDEADEECPNMEVRRELSRQIVYAVHYIHSNGIVHRGAKPFRCSCL